MHTGVGRVKNKYFPISSGLVLFVFQRLLTHLICLRVSIYSSLNLQLESLKLKELIFKKQFIFMLSYRCG